jgi:hypothetical protein
MIKLITEEKQKQISNWLEAHKKAIVIAMLVTIFINLLIMVFSVLTLKEKPQKDKPNPLKQAREKIQETTKTKFINATNVTEMYQKANIIMKKDSLTKADYEELKQIDSTMQSLIRAK